MIEEQEIKMNEKRRMFKICDYISLGICSVSFLLFLLLCVLNRQYMYVSEGVAWGFLGLSSGSILMYILIHTIIKLREISLTGTNLEVENINNMLITNDSVVQ